MSSHLLWRLVLKELADNGLDAGGQTVVGRLPDGGYYVEDDGVGISGTPEEIAQRFSISRPMVSSKPFRLPTRGAFGNGLRVVAGAVLASEGSLTVMTRNRRIELRPETDGTTTVVSVEDVDHRQYTCVGTVFAMRALSYTEKITIKKIRYFPQSMENCTFVLRQSSPRARAIFL